MIQNISDIGGVFFLLAFWHFIIDWYFQSHYQAFNKTKKESVLIKHCAIYTIAFSPIIFLLFGINYISAILIFTLFINHMIVDTYQPTLWWVTRIRKPDFDPLKTQEENLQEFVKTPIGLVLIIAIDQMYHLVSIIPLSFGFVTKQYNTAILVSMLLILIFMIMCKSFMKEKL